MAILKREGWPWQTSVACFLIFLFTLLTVLGGCGPSNHAPVAVITANPTSGEAPLEVSFDASRSYDPDGTITSYEWDFGDGEAGQGSTVTHTYTSQGTYTARVTVIDNEGATGSASVTITASPPAAPSFTYNRQKAIKYAEDYWKKYNPDYGDYREQGGDCANFVSQCLIAGGLDLSRYPGASGKGGTIISCTYLQDYLVNYLGARYETRSASEKEPEWFEPGDVAIFPTPKHAVFAVGYDKNHQLVYNDHFLKSGNHHKTIGWYFARGWDYCTYYHIPGEPSLNQPPTVIITSPADGSTFNEGDRITFQGSATDPEDGTLTGSSLVWTSSIDGQIGTGESFSKSDLSVGTHTITLTATDSQGATGTASVTIVVSETAPPEPAKGKIAFTSDRGGNWDDDEIFVMNVDGSNQHDITNDSAHDADPTWSPDGTKIAFVSYRDINDEIYVMNADGSDQHNITNTPLVGEWDPAWSPDGTKIAFMSIRNSLYGIYVMNADGSNQHVIINDPAKCEDPTWSPDGTKIAFASNRNGNSEIYVMNADGTDLRNITNDPAQDWYPAWSPDGTKIAFVSHRSGSYDNWDIYVMNADGSDQHSITNDPDGDWYPAWSPDGTKIAFVSNRDGNWDIYVMNADGSNVQRITNDLAYKRDPAWSPVLP